MSAVLALVEDVEVDRTPRSTIEVDPRRPRRESGKARPMLAVWCWCGRFYTLTPEEHNRLNADTTRTTPCPEQCGKGAE